MLNLYAQIRQGAKFVRANLQVAKNSYDFGAFWLILAHFKFELSNWQCAKFVCTNLQVAKNSYNFGTFWVILALFNFVRSN